MRRTRSLAVCILTVTALLLALNVAAETPRSATLDVDTDGWAPVAQGVWQRLGSDGRVTTRAQGLDGLAWALPSLRQELEVLTRAFLARPDDAELRRSLDRHLAVIEDVELRIAAGVTALPEAAGGCTRTFTISAAAFPEGCGAGADSLASYSTNCTETCSVHASASASRVCNGQTFTDSDTCSDDGTNVSCSAAASSTGPFSLCFSEAYAYIYCPDLNDLLIEEYDSNNLCQDGSQLCFPCRLQPLGLR